MGHCRTIKHFAANATLKQISDECDKWATCNCDQQEHGFCEYNILITDISHGKIFANQNEADEYLEANCIPWEGAAVRYYEVQNRKPSATETSMQNTLKKLRTRLCELEKPHYVGVKSKYVACPKCGSRLATVYCGNTWNNNCPICHTDVRPDSKKEQVTKCRADIAATEKALKRATLDEDKKQQARAKVHWAVILDVHC